MISLGPGIAAAADAPAASRAFTSDDPVVVAARALLESGDLADVERMVDAAASEGDDIDSGARAELLELARRVRHDYAVDEQGLLAAVRTVVPDATTDEVSAWVAEARLASRVIDGRRLLHRRASQNLFLFSARARGRRDALKPPQTAPWSLVDHAKAAAAEAARTGSDRVLPVQHRVTHTITIPATHPAIKPGVRVQAWLPFPQETHLQREVRLVEAGPGEPHVAAAGRLDPVSEGCLQRSLYLEAVVADPPRPLVFREVFEFVSYAFCPTLDESRAAPLPADWGDAFLGERPPHIVFTPEIRRQVAEIVGEETNPLARARLIFRWVSRSIPWHAEDEYSTIPSLSVRGFTVRRGDCGVQNTLFITMCRIAGIPARWQSGFETRPVTGIGMHDWAEIHLPPWGWLPADASYGVQVSDDPRVADFFCGGCDSYRLTVNLDWGRDLCPPLPGLRSEPADFQRGEVAVDGRPLYFDAWSCRTTVERQPGPQSSPTSRPTGLR
ncbi:MAG: transglutaminase-like domain-containing protein [Planctomycetes bacterium]|nr:transglutaminase-like domain-containing protein [Planctomycetota bacterium]